jgi:hypothetical protein
MQAAAEKTHVLAERYCWKNQVLQQQQQQQQNVLLPGFISWASPSEASLAAWQQRSQ